MKIFFTASIHGKEKYLENYQSIVDATKGLGYKIQADHVLNVSTKDIASWDSETNLNFHKEIIKNIRKADIIFAEVSYHSTSVGYLLSEAQNAGRPVILFYSGDQAPHLLPTLESYEKLQLISYNNNTNLKMDIQLALDYASEQQDTRFNFFISPKIAGYLDWMAKSKRMPRAVYLRELIQQHMENDEEYQSS